MDKFLIKGGKALRGTVAISGAKNSALPAMAAALLTAERVTLHNIPKVRDLITMSKLLAFMDAKVSVPGGCAIGARPVDLHLKALEQMGAVIGTSHGYIEARAPKGRLKGAHIVFEKITVTGTENILMAAALADGETVLENAAREPEVADLIVMLGKMGARIEGDGSSKLRIRGVEKLRGTEHTVIPDRIEAGTFLVAGAITGGDLTVTHGAPEHLGAVIAKMEQAGVPIEIVNKTTLRVRGAKKLLGSDMTTEEYPGFATDMQAQYMALATQAEGTSVLPW